MAPGIQQELQQIGLTVTLRGVSHDSQVTLRSKLTGSQLSIDFWGIDFPDGYDVYSGDMACGDNGDGGTSGSHYCDPAADALVTARRGSPTGRGAQRAAAPGTGAHPALGRDGPAGLPQTVEFVSPKVGGFYYSPIFGWQFENYWLTS